jgi:hypothetical protein
VLKSSRAISRVNVELKTKVSEISSISIIRVDHWHGWTPEKIFADTELGLHVNYKTYYNLLKNYYLVKTKI